MRHQGDTTSELLSCWAISASKVFGMELATAGHYEVETKGRQGKDRHTGYVSTERSTAQNTTVGSHECRGNGHKGERVTVYRNGTRTRSSISWNYARGFFWGPLLSAAPFCPRRGRSVRIAPVSCRDGLDVIQHSLLDTAAPS